VSRLVAALAALLLVAGGCGLPDDDEPRVIGPDEAPLDLAPTTVTVEADSAGDDEVAVFFIDRSSDPPRLAPVRRTVPSITPRVAVEQVLVGVLPGDPPAYASSIPQGTVVLESTHENGILTLNLGPAEGGITSIQGQNLLEAFAQIVRTATGVSGVQGVRFRVEGQPISPPTDAGAAEADRPVDRDDYASLAPNPSG
jgi:spore germination protein GerM